jgi:hypothetical protein
VSEPRPEPELDELRRRLFRELARGADADLREVLAALGALAEPPAEADALILASAAGAGPAQEPPARVDEAILAASRAAAAEARAAAVIPLRPRRVRVAAVATGLAMAVGIALVVGLRARSGGGGGGDADEQVRVAVARLTAEVAARNGREAAYRLTGAEPPPDRREPGSVRLPGWEELPGKAPAPGDRAPPLAGAEADRFAQGLVAFTDRARSGASPEVLETLEAGLARERGRCPDRSRCHELLSAQLAELALQRRQQQPSQQPPPPN